MAVTYISHSGVLNMKWGQRKYQNPDGTWTEEGKARRRAAYSKSKGAVSKVIKGNKPKVTPASPSKPSAQQKPQPQKPAQSKNDDYLKDQLEEERRTAEELKRERQEAMELAEYRARMAELNKRTVEANTRIRDLTKPVTVQSTFERYFAPALANGVQNVVSNAGTALGNAFVKKLTSGSEGNKADVQRTIQYDKDGNVISKSKIIRTREDY